MATDPLNEYPQQPLKTTQAVPAPRKQNSYFRNIGEATRTLLGGLKLTWRHFLESRESRKPVGVEHENYFEQQTGIVTLQYPRESLPVPDNARYRLHNEIEDCIVCDKCAKVCPVDCIEIEPIKAVETIGQTSDGTSKRLYAARFDIDMAKCCFCGLCTTVCPTECLTMTKVYDFSEFDVADHTYAFSEMTPLEILQKRKELEEYQAQKATAKPAAAKAGSPRPGVARPAGAAKPSAARLVAAAPAAPDTVAAGAAAPKSEEDVQEAARKLMAQKHTSGVAQPNLDALAKAPNPTVKSAPTPEGTEDSPAPGAEKPKFRPRVVMKPKTTGRGEGEENTAAAPSAASQAEAPQQAALQQAAPKPRPVMKPVVKKAAAPSEEPPAAKAGTTDSAAPEQIAPKQVTPEQGTLTQAASAQKEVSAAPARPRPVMKPVIKKARPSAEAFATQPARETPKAEAGAGSDRPRPVMKPIVKKAAPAADTEAAGEAPHPVAGSPAAGSPAAGSASGKPRPVIKPLIRKTDSPAPASKEGDIPAAEQQKPRPVIKPVVPKQSMQAEDTPEEKRDGEQGIKQPKPIVEKKVVVRKPPQEDKSEDDKQQEEGQRPGPPGKPL